MKCGENQVERVIPMELASASAPWNGNLSQDSQVSSDLPVEIGR